MSLAGGEFMVVMDSDDFAMPQRLQWQVQYLRDHKDCLAVGRQVEDIDPDGDILGTRQL